MLAAAKTIGVRGISSAGRAPALQAGGRRFDPVILHQFHSAGTTRKRARSAGSTRARLRLVLEPVAVL